MISVQLRPIFNPGDPMHWDVYTYIDGKLVLVEKLRTAVAQRRLDQVRVERARAEAALA